MNDTDIRNKNKRNLNRAHRAVFWSHRVSIPTLHFSFQCLQNPGLVHWCRYSCSYPTFVSLNFYLYSSILPLPGFSVSKQTHFSCSGFLVVLLPFFLHKKPGREQSRESAQGSCCGCRGLDTAWVSTSSCRWHPGVDRWQQGGSRNAEAKEGHGTTGGSSRQSLGAHVENGKENITALQGFACFQQF